MMVLNRLFNGRKGEDEGGGVLSSSLLVTVLFVIILLVVSLILISMKNNINKSLSPINNCRRSIELKTATTITKGGITLTDPVSLDCKRRIIKIFDDHIEVNGKKTPIWDPISNRYITTFKIDEDIVKTIFSDELANCWYAYHEGTLPFLKNYQLFSFNYFSDWPSLCGSCAEISFDDSAKKVLKEEGITNIRSPLLGEGNKITDLTASFLYQRLVSPDLSKNRMTYYEYLFNDDALCNEDSVIKSFSGKSSINDAMAITAIGTLSTKPSLDDLSCNLKQLLKMMIFLSSKNNNPSQSIKDLLTINIDESYSIILEYIASKGGENPTIMSLYLPSSEVDNACNLFFA